AYYLERNRLAALRILSPLHLAFHSVCHLDNIGVLVGVDLQAQARLAVGAGDGGASRLAQLDRGYIFQPDERHTGDLTLPLTLCLRLPSRSSPLGLAQFILRRRPYHRCSRQLR